MTKRRMATKVVATAVAFSLALGFSPVVNAAKKKPALNKKSLTLMAGETATLKVKANKNKISTVKWKSTNEAVATVSKKGKIKTWSEGKATIKATFKVKGAKKKTTLKCKVKVEIAPTVGGWERAEDPTIPDDVTEELKEYLDKMVGAKYEPVAAVATQVIAGIKVRALCKTTPVTENPTPYYTLVEAGVGVDGEVTFEVVGSTEAVLKALDTTATASPVIPAEAKDILTADITGFNSHLAPVAVIGSKVKDNVTSYLVLCDVDADGTNVSDAGYVLVTLSIDSEKKATIGKLYPIALSRMDDTYKVCTDLPATSVEAFAAYVRNNVAQSDWTKVSEMIRYPIEINKEEIADAKAFLDFVAKNPPSESFMKAITNELCTKVSARDQGVMLGDGQIWFNENATKDGFEITTIQLWADK